MELIKTAEVSKEPAASPLFTGGPVTRQSLLDEEMRKYFNMSMVNFSKGARNKFHSHTSDQVLVVTVGKGIVATEQEEVIVGEGAIIHIPAGEKHWHGATEDSELSHIYVTAADSETTQLED